MVFGDYHNAPAALGLAAAIALSSVFISGCGGQESANQAINKALAATGASKDATGRVAGTVTIDGQVPPDVMPLTIAMLYNTNKPPDEKHPPMYTVVNSNGEFEFSTYGKGDGVPVGPYVLLFARLNRQLMGRGWFPPDGLKNLYNDPDKNTEPEFKIEVTPDGKTSDLHIDLKVEGRDAVTNPGPRAITKLVH